MEGRILAAVRGGWLSRILLAAHRLGVFRSLAEGPATASTLARRLGCTPRGLAALLGDLAQAGLVSMRGRVFQDNGAASLLVGPGSPLGAYVDLHVGLQSSWDRLARSVRAGAPPAEPWNQRAGAGFVRRYLSAMNALGRWPAKELARVWRLRPGETLLDIGGGGGVFSRAVLDRQPKARSVILERPAACRVLRSILPGGASIELQPGNYLTYDGRGRFDAVLLANILHNEPPAGVKAVLRTAYRALKPGGRLAVVDYMNQAGGERGGLAGFRSVLVLITPAGRSYDAAQLRAWLGRSGFAVEGRPSSVGGMVMLCGSKR